jgi:cobalamin-dependent methionine synthase I
MPHYLNLYPYINKRNIFLLNWKFGGKTSKKKQDNSSEELESLFQKWISIVRKNQWIEPQGIYGLFPAKFRW